MPANLPTDDVILHINTDQGSRQQQQLDAQDIDDAGKALGATIACVAIIFAIFNLAFIIPNLVYAYQGSQCVTTITDGIAFNLSTWLQVDAYMRIAMVVLLLIVGIAMCINVAAGMTCGMCVICFMIVYSIFAFAWTIVGSVLFWGKLNPTGVCTGGVQVYMYILLIITYVATCCNCLYSLNSGKTQRQL